MTSHQRSREQYIEEVPEGLWMGKRIGDMSFRELYEVIGQLTWAREQDREQHLKDLEMLRPQILSRRVTAFSQSSPHIPKSN